jgi:hypothetical protein
LVVIGGSLRIGWRWGAGEIGFDHVGDDGGRLGDIDAREDRMALQVHGRLSAVCATAQPVRTSLTHGGRGDGLHAMQPHKRIASILVQVESWVNSR